MLPLKIPLESLGPVDSLGATEEQPILSKGIKFWYYKPDCFVRESPTGRM